MGFRRRPCWEPAADLAPPRSRNGGRPVCQGIEPRDAKGETGREKILAGLESASSEQVQRETAKLRRTHLDGVDAIPTPSE